MDKHFFHVLHVFIILVSGIVISTSQSLNAQVTIGSSTAPITGALLDLRQDDNTLPSGATSQKGILMPRVKLSDLNKLKMGTNEILDGTDKQYEQHVGLVVYHVSGEAVPECAPIPDGFYVWDGEKWQGININKTGSVSTLEIPGGNIDFASGLDMRTLATIQYPITWSPIDKQVVYTNTPNATWGGISFNQAGTIPSGGNLTTGTATFNLLANAMTADDIKDNPFRTKQNVLEFVLQNDCGTDVTIKRTISQTNKALTLTTSTKDYTENKTAETNTLKTNANWVLVSREPNDNSNAISNVKINDMLSAIPSANQTGFDRSDNTGKEAKLTYDVNVSNTMARYSTLTFADANTPKRFGDVVLTVLQCVNESEQPKMSSWAARAGFSGVTDEFVSIEADRATKIDTPNSKTGIAWHRDQDGNVFLSSSFHPTDITGDSERWMIINLAAKTYAQGVTHSHNRKLTGPNGDATYKDAYWAYPRPHGTDITTTDATESKNYKENPRLGRLYTWDAATAGKGGLTGQAILNEGNNQTSAMVQGICPNGWHLPSDYEWTQMETQYYSNASKFSSSADGIGALNRDKLGTAMKEECEKTGGSDALKGTSNSITTAYRPGFNTFQAGFISRKTASSFGVANFYATSSGYGQDQTYVRTFNKANDKIVQDVPISRYYLISVRCKKTN